MADEPWDLTKPQPGPGSPPPAPAPGATGPTATPGWPAPSDAGTPPTDDSGLRASDDDRTRTVEWLCWAAGNGQLTLDETDDRLARAYSARTVGELSGLTADLQPQPPEPEPKREPGLGDRMREMVPRSLPLLIPILLLLFITTAVASHGHAVFPWLVVIAFFIARQHRRHHRTSDEHRHHQHHRHHLSPPTPPPPPGTPDYRAPWAPPERNDG
jgi:hypothetical protein